MRHPRRNEVFRDVGSTAHEPDDEGFIEVERVAFHPDSAMLLCSDGLSDLVPSAAIRSTVMQHAGDPQQAVADLIVAANSAGGKDNVTVVLVEGERFASAILDGLPTPIPPDDAVANLRVIEAVFAAGTRGTGVATAVGGVS